jgi:hypothetical protein
MNAALQAGLRRLPAAGIDVEPISYSKQGWCGQQGAGDPPRMDFDREVMLRNLLFAITKSSPALDAAEIDCACRDHGTSVSYNELSRVERRRAACRPSS